MFDRMKRLGIVFIVEVALAILVWALFFCLRYWVFQHSATLAEGLRTHYMNIRSIYKNFFYFDSWSDAVWKITAWFATFYAFAVALLLVLEGIKKIQPKFFILAVFSLVGVIPLLDFCGSSGEYFYYLQRFLGNNYFYFFGITGFLVYGAFITGFTAAVCGFGLWGNDEQASPYLANEA